MSGFRREMRAYGEADKIVGVSERIGFVKIVHAPDEPTFDVAPGAEIFDVQIAHGEHAGCFGKIGANLRPDLGPSIVRGAKKRKHRLLHSGVFQLEISFDDQSALGEPVLKLTGGFDNVHRANDNDAMGRKSTREAGLENSHVSQKTARLGAPYLLPIEAGLLLVERGVLFDELFLVFGDVFQRVDRV